MALRIEWDESEIALLIEASENVLRKKVTPTDAVKELSAQLRKRAVNRGIAIDDVFRNENGVSLQMWHIFYLMTNGKTGLRGAGQHHVEMYEIRKKDPKYFLRILKKAKAEIDGTAVSGENTDKRALFAQWLKTKSMRFTSPEVLLNAMDEASEYCVLNNYCQRSFWLVDTRNEFSRAISRLSGSRSFSKTNPAAAEHLGRAASFYKDFLKSLNAQSTSEKSSPDPVVPAKETPPAQPAPNSTPAKKEPPRVSDAEYIRLYNDLLYVSRVFDDPNGMTLKRIIGILGRNADETTVRGILGNVSWAHQIAPDVYLFSSKKGSAQTPAAAPLTAPVPVRPAPDVQAPAAPDPAAFSQPSSAPAKPAPAAPVARANEFDKEKYIAVLMRRFRNGMTFDSIDFDNFRDTYEMLYDEAPKCGDDVLEKQLRSCGVVYNDRLYPAEGIIDSALKEKLFAYIDASFASGKKVLYYQAICEDFTDDFASCYTLDGADMLHAYIAFAAERGKYFYYQQYMTKERFVKIDHTSEVEECLLSAGKPMSVTDVCTALTHLPEDKVDRIIKSDARFLRNAKGEYFHEGIFEASDRELEQITGIINGMISENDYAVWSDVWNILQDKMPIFLENNLYLSSLGVRNALARRLADKFEFGPIISTPDKNYDRSAVYRLYAEHHPTFTAEEIYNFSKELDSVIYLDAIFEVSVRVSRDLFVSKDQIAFDVDAVDCAVASFMARDYIRVREIDSFLAFPNVGYEWNEYLLESYLNSYSRKFKLLNNGFAMNNVAGFAVKKGGSIAEFSDACAAFLAEGRVALKKADALQYLMDKNVISRKSYQKIDDVLRAAAQIRARKG